MVIFQMLHSLQPSSEPISLLALPGYLCRLLLPNLRESHSSPLQRLGLTIQHARSQMIDRLGKRHSVTDIGAAWAILLG
jgi:hypothetical protein